MKTILSSIIILTIFAGCSKNLKPVILLDSNESKACLMFDCLPKTYLIKSSFQELPDFENENFDMALTNFNNSCVSSKTKEFYPSLCEA